MKKILKPIEYQVYKGLYIENLDEAAVAKKLGFISNEKGRSPGYRQIKNITKSIIIKAKSYIEKEQPNTKYDLWERIKPYDNEKQNYILIDFDTRQFTQQSFTIIQQLPDIITESGEIGEFELEMNHN